MYKTLHHHDGDFLKWKEEKKVRGHTAKALQSVGIWSKIFHTYKKVLC